MEQGQPHPYTVGSVVSRDGTTIGYRQFGDGPGIIAVHGAAQAAQNFTKLAEALSDAFTVYVPDRRGRGRSGPPGQNYGLQTECEDLDALLSSTGSHNVFGLSSGALISLRAALTLPSIRKVALYEPPLSINHSTPIDWANRYDREVAAGKLGSAMVTAVRGTQTGPRFFRLVPRLFIDPLLNAATHSTSTIVEAPKGWTRRPGAVKRSEFCCGPYGVQAGRVIAGRVPLRRTTMYRSKRSCRRCTTTHNLPSKAKDPWRRSEPSLRMCCCSEVPRALSI